MCVCVCVRVSVTPHPKDHIGDLLVTGISSTKTEGLLGLPKTLLRLGLADFGDLFADRLSGDAQT